jgi:hypothetical protein
MELKGTPIIDDGMTSVISAAVADNHVRLLREQIDDSAFAFIAPLPANNGNNRHTGTSYYVLRTRFHACVGIERRG